MGVEGLIWRKGYSGEKTRSLKMHTVVGRAAWVRRCLDGYLPISHDASRSITKVETMT